MTGVQTCALPIWAICTGIDIATGITTYSMRTNTKTIFSDVYEEIDSTTDLKENKKLSGISIPNWDEILTIALKCQEASKLGFLGVDISIDRKNGPVVFELNARPGIGIQVANKAGLRGRLELVKGIKVKGIKHGIKIAKNLFGGEVEESIEAVSGRKVVNIIEKILLFNKSAGTKTKKMRRESRQASRAFMDTGITTSRITETTANRIGYISTIKYFKLLDFYNAQKKVLNINNRLSP